MLFDLPSNNKYIQKLTTLVEVPLKRAVSRINRKFPNKDVIPIYPPEIFRATKIAAVIFFALGILFIALSSLYSLFGLLVFCLGMANLTTGLGLYNFILIVETHWKAHGTTNPTPVLTIQKQALTLLLS